ncbi:hypothetical protein PspLS_04864 [Pyricularia sp. CBS 133598]|nr:hypothetical protein PspLS_04864 [Pyricularia sp. CBS 133598]
MSAFTSSGRGGAGNIVDKTKSPRIEPKDLETPTLKTSVVTTGRGGTGNMAKNVDPAETRAMQDVAPVPRQELSGGTHVGRGGTGNVFKPKPEDEEMGNVQHNAENPQEGSGDKEPQQVQDNAAGVEEQNKAADNNQGLAAKGKQWLFGKKTQSAPTSYRQMGLHDKKRPDGGAATVLDVMEAVASGEHLSMLQSHLPYSFPVLRRLQFSRAAGGSSPTAKVLLATSGDSPHVAVAYVDVHKAPETQMWIYSSLEDSCSLGGQDPPEISLPSSEVDVCLEQVVSILRRAGEVAREAGPGIGAVGVDGVARANGVMVGSLHEALRLLLLGKGVTMSYSNPHYKWLFRVEDLPTCLASPLTEEMAWDTIRREDVPLIKRRTNIPKTESTLLTLPSLGIRLTDSAVLVAWSFLGVDGSLSTLHCEEPYRGRGIAKAMATKLIITHNGHFGSDGWCSADVHVENRQSAGVCRSIGGKMGWRVSWSVVDIDGL